MAALRATPGAAHTGQRDHERDRELLFARPAVAHGAGPTHADRAFAAMTGGASNSEGTRAPLEIAPAEPAELEPILALHREAGWPGTHLEGAVWAAREGGFLVGSAQLVELAPALLLIDAVVVRTGARGRGIGAELVRTVLATRAAQWWLECRLERVAFYQRLGFALVDEPAVPALVRARVGGNRERPQRFLCLATSGPGEVRPDAT
jgi:predicted N-acetyltransferase YhbS